MSDEISEIIHGDNNGNEKKDAIIAPTTPKKRTPSKRASFIERAQKESEELIKNMGLDLDIGGGRKTRSSTRGTPNRHVVESSPPPSKKSKGETPTSTPRRGRPKKIDVLPKPQTDNDEGKNKKDTEKIIEITNVEKDKLDQIDISEKSVIEKNEVESNNDKSKIVMETEENIIIEDKTDSKDDVSDNKNDTSLSKETITIEDKSDLSDAASEDATTTNPDKLVIVEDKIDLTDDKSEDVVKETNEDSKEPAVEVNNVTQSKNISTPEEKNKTNCANPLDTCESEETKHSSIVDPIEKGGSAAESQPNVASDSPQQSVVYEIHNSDSSGSSIEIISCKLGENKGQSVGNDENVDAEQSNLLNALPNSEPPTPLSEEKEEKTTALVTMSAVSDPSDDNCELKTSTPPTASLQETISTP